MEKLHRSPFRCRNCKHRFYLYIAPERDEEENEEPLDAVEPEGDAPEPKGEPARNPHPC